MTQVHQPPTARPVSDTPFGALVQSVTVAMQHQLDAHHKKTVDSVVDLLRSRESPELIPVSTRLSDLKDLITYTVPGELEKELVEVKRERECLQAERREAEHIRTRLEYQEADVYKRKRVLRRFSDMVAQGGVWNIFF